MARHEAWAWSNMSNSSDRPRLWFYYWVYWFKIEKMRWTHRHRMDADEILLLFAKNETKRRRRRLGEIIIKIMISLTMRSVHPMRIHFMRESSKKAVQSLSHSELAESDLEFIPFFVSNDYYYYYLLAVCWAVPTSRPKQQSPSPPVERIQCEYSNQAVFTKKGSAVFAFCRIRIWNLWFAFFQIVSISFRKKENHLCQMRSNWMKREQLFRIWSEYVCRLIVRRSRSPNQLPR